jgi:predicted AlkP superfamily pyrophosphatase or phosphodiesterase
MVDNIVIIDVVGLEKKHISSDLTPNIYQIAEEGQLQKLQPVFPAVTCTVQSSILSGTYPDEHGIISNGFYDRKNYSVSFWEQSSNLVESKRIWDVIKENKVDHKCAVLFWQNIMYANADFVLTPRPLHMDDGMVMWCYGKPAALYDELVNRIGDFDLTSYWGPLASYKSSEWITNATELVLEQRPNVLLTYIPHLDYVFQKSGTSVYDAKEIKFVDDLIGRIVNKTIDIGTRDKTQFILHSEYGFYDVDTDISLNRILRDNDLLSVRKIHGKEYLDLELSKAFAMVDHQIAHIYIKDQHVDQVKKILENTDGVDKVLDKNGKKEFNVNHERSGELIAISEKNKWFSYYWWWDEEYAPPFARKVDIHRKPGYDPSELFFDPRTRSIPLNGKLVRGSHGRIPLSEENSGYAFYVSNKKDDVELNKEGNINATSIGMYLNKVLT